MEPLEIRLLKSYRLELNDTREQIRALTVHGQALTSAIAGLEAVLRIKGVDAGPILSVETAGRAPEAPETRHSAPTRLLGAVVALLAERGLVLGAKDIHRLLHKSGIVVNYHTLYKNLSREATREGRVIAKVGEKFGLPE
jgi:hypothetical protein